MRSLSSRFFLMTRRPARATPTDTLLPDTTLFLSVACEIPSDVTGDITGEIASHNAFEITTESIEKVNISSKYVIPIPRVISGYGWSESNFRITIISVRVVDIEIPNVDGQIPESIRSRAKPKQPAPNCMTPTINSLMSHRLCNIRKEMYREKVKKK